MVDVIEEIKENIEEGIEVLAPKGVPRESSGELSTKGKEAVDAVEEIVEDVPEKKLQGKELEKAAEAESTEKTMEEKKAELMKKVGLLREMETSLFDVQGLI